MRIEKSLMTCYECDKILQLVDETMLENDINVKTFSCSTCSNSINVYTQIINTTEHLF
jgi:hypothetical protein